MHDECGVWTRQLGSSHCHMLTDESVSRGHEA